MSRRRTGDAPNSLAPPRPQGLLFENAEAFELVRRAARYLEAVYDAGIEDHCEAFCNLEARTLLLEIMDQLHTDVRRVTAPPQ